MKGPDLIVPERTEDVISPRFSAGHTPRVRVNPDTPPSQRYANGAPQGQVQAGAAVKQTAPDSAALRTRRSRVPEKAPGANVRADYALTIEIGGILALLALIWLFHVDIQFSQELENVVAVQETVQMEEIKQTKQEVKPPPPPRPPTPVAVANDVVLEDVDLNLDAALDIGEPLVEMPPPPPPPPEEPREVVEEVEAEIFVVVEEMPELIGGLESIQARIRYPEMARRAGISGRVFVQFIVDKDGTVTDPVVIRGIGGGCDEEALRAVREAKFKPGKQRGKAVRVRYVLPIVFRLK